MKTTQKMAREKSKQGYDTLDKDLLKKKKLNYFLNYLFELYSSINTNLNNPSKDELATLFILACQEYLDFNFMVDDPCNPYIKLLDSIFQQIIKEINRTEDEKQPLTNMLAGITSIAEYQNKKCTYGKLMKESRIQDNGLTIFLAGLRRQDTRTGTTPKYFLYFEILQPDVCRMPVMIPYLVYASIPDEFDHSDLVENFHSLKVNDSCIPDIRLPHANVQRLIITEDEKQQLTNMLARLTTIAEYQNNSFRYKILMIQSRNQYMYNDLINFLAGLQKQDTFNCDDRKQLHNRYWPITSDAFGNANMHSSPRTTARYRLYFEVFHSDVFHMPLKIPVLVLDSIPDGIDHSDRVEHFHSLKVNGTCIPDIRLPHANVQRLIITEDEKQQLTNMLARLTTISEHQNNSFRCKILMIQSRNQENDLITFLAGLQKLCTFNCDTEKRLHDRYWLITSNIFENANIYTRTGTILKYEVFHPDVCRMPVKIPYLVLAPIPDGIDHSDQVEHYLIQGMHEYNNIQQRLEGSWRNLSSFDNSNHL